MVTKTRGKKTTKKNTYVVTTGGGKQKTITAQNVQEAYAKAGRLFPKAKVVTVSRKPLRGGRGYETYTIIR